MDYQQQVAFRNSVYELYPFDQHPKYLLANEIRTLSSLPTIKEDHRMLLLFLFNTGARISECLAVTPNDIKEVNGKRRVLIKTLKQQMNKPKGAPREGYTRHVDLFDSDFYAQLSRYINSHCQNKKHPIFKGITRQAARNWLKEIERCGKLQGLDMPVSLSPKVMRHSFAVHLILHQVPLKKVQGLLGHKYASSTEIYTRLFSLDIDLGYEIKF